MGEKNRCIDLVLPNPKGGFFTVKLSRYDFTSSGFKLATDANGKETPLEYAPGLHYRGVVEGMPGSIAAFSFFNNEVSGIFSIPHVGNYVMIANSVVNTESAGNPSYVLYNDLDVKLTPTGPVCSAEMLPGYMDPIKDQIDAQSKNKFDNCKEVQVYVRTDYQCYVTKQNNATNLTNQVTAIFNIVSTVYRNEGIYLALKTLIMNTTSMSTRALLKAPVTSLPNLATRHRTLCRAQTLPYYSAPGITPLWVVSHGWMFFAMIIIRTRVRAPTHSLISAVLHLRLHSNIPGIPAPPRTNWARQFRF